MPIHHYRRETVRAGGWQGLSPPTKGKELMHEDVYCCEQKLSFRFPNDAYCKKCERSYDPQALPRKVQVANDVWVQTRHTKNGRNSKAFGPFVRRLDILCKGESQ
jgi:hypothetical protein